MIHQKLYGMAFPMRAVRGGIAVMIALIAASMWLNWKVGRSQSAAIEKEVAVVTASQKVHDYCLLLKTTVKAAVANGDAEAAAPYRTLQPELRQTLTALRAARTRRNRADRRRGGPGRLAPVSIEYEALELANAGDLDAAARLIGSEEYARLVRIYEEGIQAVSRSAAGYVRAMRARVLKVASLGAAELCADRMRAAV